MSWRDFQLSTPIDKSDKIDKGPPKKPFVDIVDIVDKEEPTPRPSKGVSSHGHFSPAVNDNNGSQLNRTHKEGLQPNPIAETVWGNPHAPGTPEARRASLMAVMEATWTKEFEGIITKVLNGKARIADFQKAIEAWKRMVETG